MVCHVVTKTLSCNSDRAMSCYMPAYCKVWGQTRHILVRPHEDYFKETDKGCELDWTVFGLDQVVVSICDNEHSISWSFIWLSGWLVGPFKRAWRLVIFEERVSVYVGVQSSKQHCKGAEYWNLLLYWTYSPASESEYQGFLLG